MTAPDAIRKHDGRLVAFDLRRLAASVSAAALSGGERTSRDEALAFGTEIARAAAAFLAKEKPPAPATADAREMVLKLLRETGHAKTAEAYADHARSATSFLWRLRVSDGTTAGEGSPWDRRRLIESLRGSGIAKDPAGECAREAERRILALGLERVSPALIHALAELALRARGLDPRAYAARRIAASFTELVPRYDAAAAALKALPAAGPALEAFWLQAVHSPEVASAAQANLLGLEPYPSRPSEETNAPTVANALDPLKPDAAERLRAWLLAPPAMLWVRADDPTRAAELARVLGALEHPSKARPAGANAAELGMLLRPLSPLVTPKGIRAPAVSLNLGGLMLREALRDPHKATVRLAHLATLAAQAHREREEYWGFSAARGRELPVAAAGLWNAAAHLIGEPFDRVSLSPALRLTATALATSLYSAVSTLRQETGMNLLLTTDAPAAAGAALWRRDRDHAARDGMNLDALGSYGGLDLRIGPGAEDLAERVDFLRAATPLFDEPPALRMEAPLAAEPDPAAWRELLTALAQNGIPRLRCTPGSSGRGMRLIARQLRSHAEGFPLFTNG
ncbi:MAG: hypothetical protein KIS92_08680 [Planctomycetota bacterium]|nr:hypothetical protein [Planctomycetota bacterium]